jgi:hypothetical protein
MAVTPFHDAPKKLFLTRMLGGPAVAAFAAGWLVLGIVSEAPQFAQARGPAAEGSLFRSAGQTVGSFLSKISRMPEVCWSGDTVNEFQGKQCERYWNDLYVAGGLSAIPFVAVGLLMLMGLDQLNGLYRRSRRKVESGKATFGGTVTSPAVAANDIFGWFFCFRAVAVQLSNKTQVKVYMPLSVPVPLPGQAVAVFEAGRVFGTKRYVAILYAPHVAVVRGA